MYTGNLDFPRNSGHTKGCVRMQWVLPWQDPAENFVIATALQYLMCEFIR